MKINVQVYGKVETVEASEMFWLKMLNAIFDAAEYTREHGYTVAASEYERIHDEISNKLWDGVMKM